MNASDLIDAVIDGQNAQDVVNEASLRVYSDGWYVVKGVTKNVTRLYGPVKTEMEAWAAGMLAFGAGCL